MGASLLLVSLAATVGTSLIQAKQQVAAGRRREQEADFQASQEELTGIQRERERSRSLAAALATTSTRRAAGGIQAFSGSPLAQLAELQKEHDISTERDQFATRTSAGSRRAAAKRSRGGAALGLLSDAVKIAPLVGGAFSGGGIRRQAFGGSGGEA